MDEELALYMTLIENAGGSISYRALYDAWPQDKRYRLPSVKRLARDKNLARAHVSINRETGEVSHLIVKV